MLLRYVQVDGFRLRINTRHVSVVGLRDEEMLMCEDFRGINRHIFKLDFEDVNKPKICSSGKN